MVGLCNMTKIVRTLCKSKNKIVDFETLVLKTGTRSATTHSNISALSGNDTVNPGWTTFVWRQVASHRKHVWLRFWVSCAQVLRDKLVTFTTCSSTIQYRPFYLQLTIHWKYKCSRCRQCIFPSCNTVGK